MEFLKKNLKRPVPAYMAVALMIGLAFVIVGCGMIPTSYTTNTSQKNLTRQNTLLQIEFLRRFEKMDPTKRLVFLKKNVEFAIAIEEIICGEVSKANELFKKAVEDIKETETPKPADKPEDPKPDSE